MPSGRTHDSITLWSLPLVAGLTLERTQSAGMTLWVSGGFLFSGLMFGPDLDIHSQQFKRWGMLRWIWLPYQRSLRHRSIWSHAPILGTAGRISYLLLCLFGAGVVLILVSAGLGQAIEVTPDWRTLAQQMLTDSRESVEQSLQQHWPEWLALAIGLELGALLHSLSDWTVSAYRRMVRQPSRNPARQARSLPPKLAQRPVHKPIPPAPLPRPHPSRHAPHVPKFKRRQG